MQVLVNSTKNLRTLVPVYIVYSLSLYLVKIIEDNEYFKLRFKLNRQIFLSMP